MHLLLDSSHWPQDEAVLDEDMFQTHPWLHTHCTIRMSPQIAHCPWGRVVEPILLLKLLSKDFSMHVQVGQCTLAF